MKHDGKSDRNLKRHYKTINRKFYYGELPSNVVVRWAEEGEESDIASTNEALDKRHSYVILLNREKVPTRSIKVSSLLHETIHVATQMNDNHGSAFSEWHMKLMERGAFKKNALIRGITLF